jgi:hypothetical protein
MMQEMLTFGKGKQFPISTKVSEKDEGKNKERQEEKGVEERTFYPAAGSWCDTGVCDRAAAVRHGFF